MLSFWGKDSSVVGKTFRETLPELEGQPFPALLEQVYATGKPYIGIREKATLLIDGELRSSYFNFTFKPLLNPEGQVYGILNTAIDVTQEVLAHQKLEESESRFRNMVEQTPVPITLTRGLDVVVESINTPMLRTMGKATAAEVLGKAMVEVLPHVESQAILEIAKAVMETS